ncbi:helix-turn-helix domain-containing protein [Nostoc sp. FACHB-87]|uniref:ATP-binding protein n=1 Tax=Nostocaceae TaxID=1162 RepID=UPI0016849F77|nr:MULTISPECIES: ATP-binding protein [Nostocaceae]MBD2303240.1 helix-turn-helix domain-containing protein [Nostoc sp. FACHB-190]MBD2458286.1 helix-turn-helix domain-containing protein [Nostoc sp. FACHB-87]MBD2480072.1 helix-turn-helix domain-containing protein [Anabaena sp. FACHB-83]
MSQDSLRIARTSVSTVKSALRHNSYGNQQALAEAVGCSRDTVSKFFRGVAIKYSNFVDICEKLGLEWQDIISKIRHNLPQKTYSNFVGRETEKERLLKLLSPDHAAPIITVDGIGGVGKTALAIEVAYQCLKASQNNLPDIPVFDAIIFTSAKLRNLNSAGGILTILPTSQQQFNLSNIFRAIADTLEDRTIIAEAAPEELLNAVHKSLAKQQTLLIVDNLETIDDKESVLSFLDGLPRTVKSIITTREQKSIYVHIRLTSLPEAKSLELIQHELKTKDYPGICLTEDEQKKLYQGTAGIPIAIVYAIGRLADSRSFETVLNDVQSAKGRVADFLFTQNATSLRGKPTHKILMALAIFQDAPVCDAIAAVAGLQTETSSTVQEYLEHLQQISLVSIRDSRYNILSLTRQYILAELAAYPDFEREARERWVDWYLDFAKKTGGVDWGPKESGYVQLKEEWGNLINVIEWCATQNDYKNVTNFWQYLHEPAYGYGYWRERIRWMKWLIEEAKLRGDWVTFVKITTNVSWSYIRWYSPENLKIASDLLMRAWELRHHVNLIEQDFIAHNIAQLHIVQEEYNEARIWLDRQEEIINGAEMEERYQIRRLTTVLYSRAEIFYFEKNHVQAKMLFQQVSSQAEEIEWHRYSNYAQNWLADIAIVQGEISDAEELLKTGLAVAEQNNLKRRIFCYQVSYARLEKAKGNLEEAREWAEQALDGFNQLGMIREAEEVQSLLTTLV